MSRRSHAYWLDTGHESRHPLVATARRKTPAAEPELTCTCAHASFVHICTEHPSHLCSYYFIDTVSSRVLPIGPDRHEIMHFDVSIFYYALQRCVVMATPSPRIRHPPFGFQARRRLVEMAWNDMRCHRRLILFVDVFAASLFLFDVTIPVVKNGICLFHGQGRDQSWEVFATIIPLFTKQERAFRREALAIFSFIALCLGSVACWRASASRLGTWTGVVLLVK